MTRPRLEGRSALLLHTTNDSLALNETVCRWVKRSQTFDKAWKVLLTVTAMNEELPMFLEPGKVGFRITSRAYYAETLGFFEAVGISSSVRSSICCLAQGLLRRKALPYFSRMNGIGTKSIAKNARMLTAHWYP